MSRAAALAVVAGLAWAGPAAAQGDALLERIRSVDTGWVALAYSVEEDVRVCENGVHHGRSFSGSWHGDRDYECSEGSVVLEFRVARGEIREIDLTPRRSDGIDMDLGMRDAEEVADALLTVAAGSRREEAAGDALPAAMFARGVTVWPRMLEIARDRSRPEEVRSGAVFWVGRAAAEAATVGLAAIAGDTEDAREVREAAIFALSQRPDDEGTPILMELAQSAEHADVRRQALFWLAQSESPEVLDFFERILRGG